MSISDELPIVIPAKNEEKLLPRLLRSLLKQDDLRDQFAPVPVDMYPAEGLFH